MKPVTGLPTSDYLKISQEAKIQLSSLLRLVQEIEAGTTPAYIAQYRPDIAAGLNEEQIRAVEARLRDFLDFEDRRVMILTAIGQQDRLTPELRAKIEAVTDRRELEDLYLPYKPKRRTSADEAVEKGLDPLARFLWGQKPDDADIDAEASKYVDAAKGIPDGAEALRLARAIVARWLAEDPEIRRELRRVVHDEALLIAHPGHPGRREKGKQRSPSVVGYRAKLKNVAWRQALAIRRAAKEGAARIEIQLPENSMVAHLLTRLLTNPRALFCLQLGAAAHEAFHSYFAPVFENEALVDLEERTDRDAVQAFQRNLRKLLIAPPGGRIPVLGLETNRPGGWRAAVVGADGRLLEAAIVGGAEEPANKPAEGPAPSTAAGETSDAAAEAKAEAKEGKSAAAQQEESAASGAVPEEAVPEEAADGVEASVMDAEASAAETGDSASATASASDSAEAGPESSTTAELPEAEAAAEPEVAAASDDQSDDAPRDAAEDADASEHAPPAEPPKGRGSERSKHRQTVETPRGSLGDLLKKHDVKAVTIANGPGIRQVERAIRGAIREAGAPKIFWTAVNDAGSWIYATSKAARQEWGDVEPAVRSAGCLARRFQDPLAELIQLDPRLLGIGQFHHEVDTRRLRSGLNATVESVAHQVGADLNTSSAELLTMVPGLTERLAKRIIERREKVGPFTNREQLREISGLNDRIYKQAAGFTRVHGGENVLDSTGVHPDHYPVAEKILAAAGVSAQQALENPESLGAVSLEEFQTEDTPLATLQGIVAQFQPAVRNPRGEFVPPEVPVELKAVGDLKTGMKVEGIVTNVASFGLFVDIGAEQDGLVHVSRLSDKFVEDPQTAAKVGDRILVHIIALEEGGKRISLSVKDPSAMRAPRPQGQGQGQGQRPAGPRRERRPADGRSGGAESRRSNGARQGRKEPQREGTSTRTFGPDEKAKAREAKEAEKLSLDEKLAMLQTKYRTKV
jgi:protein Tex